jgi:hypothetical protein
MILKRKRKKGEVGYIYRVLSVPVHLLTSSAGCCSLVSQKKFTQHLLVEVLSLFYSY